MITKDDYAARYEYEKQMQRRITVGIVLFVLGIIALIIIFGSFYIISPGQRGVLVTLGKVSIDSKGEGLHFKMPIIQSITKMDVKTQKYEADLTAASKDLQDVNTKIAINYHLEPGSVPTLYQTIGTDYAQKLIYPLEQESNKAATAQFTAVELITKREEVRSQMENILKEKLAPRGIVVESISIVDFKFSPSFSQAIEAKVTAEQNALAAKNKLEQIKYEAEQRVTQATAEATAIQIQVDAINKQGGDNYVQLQMIKQWNGQLPYSTGGGSIFDMRNVLAVQNKS